MTDTSPEFTRLFEEKLRGLTPYERLEMASSMFESAREIVTASIKSAHPSICERDLKKELFLRFYEAGWLGTPPSF